MKKLSLILLFLFVCIVGGFAYQNTFTAKSQEYILLQDLYDLSGKTSLSLVTPISSEQMLVVLDEIDVDELPDVAKNLYLELKNRLESPEISIKLKEDSGLKARFDASYEHYKQADNDYYWMTQKKDRKPLLLLGADLYFNDFVFGNIDYDLPTGSYGHLQDKNNNHLYSKSADNLYKTVLEMDYTGPHRAFASIGYKGTNLIVGRDRISLGNGHTGNLLFGNTLNFYDFLKANVVNGLISYDFTAVSFGNSRGSDKADHLNHPFDINTNPDYKELHQLVFVHNFSYRPVSWLTLSLSEGALTFGESFGMDLRKLNPFFVIHNTFDFDNGNDNGGNMNNFFGVEVNVNLPQKWNLNFQTIIDQIQVPAEMNRVNIPQPAFGIMLSASKTMIIGTGLSNVYFETVYTSPNLYLKEEDVASGQYWNNDLIVGNNVNYDATLDSDVSYLGYKEGPDCFLFGCGFNWYNAKNFYLEFNTSFSVHGNQGIVAYAGLNDTAISFPESKKMDFVSGSINEYKLLGSLTLNYNVKDVIDISGTAGYANYWNFQNVKGNKYSDLQYTVSVTIHTLEIFDKNNKLR